MRLSKSYALYCGIKEYDLICIGALGCKVGQMIQHQYPKLPMSKLFLNSQNHIYEPYLNQNQVIGLKNIKSWGIDQIKPDRNQIKLVTGQNISYRQLVYAPSVFQWKLPQIDKNLYKSLKITNNSVFSDLPNINLSQLFKRQCGQIIFTIPQGRHSGHQNYFMLKLLHQLQNYNKSIQYQPSKPLKITILNQSSSLFQYNEHINHIISTLLQKAGVTILNNTKIQNVDYRNKSITYQGRCRKWAAIYRYLKIGIPKILQNCNIDPFKQDKFYLNNEIYRNIFIIGNTLDVPESYYSMNIKNHIIVNNIVQQHLGQSFKSVYKGDTIIGFWNSNNSLRYFSFHYNGVNKYNNLGSNVFVSKLLALQHKCFFKSQVCQYYNGNSYGYPKYLIKPLMQQKISTI